MEKITKTEMLENVRSNYMWISKNKKMIIENYVSTKVADYIGGLCINSVRIATYSALWYITQNIFIALALLFIIYVVGPIIRARSARSYAVKLYDGIQDQMLKIRDDLVNPDFTEEDIYKKYPKEEL